MATASISRSNTKNNGDDGSRGCFIDTHGVITTTMIDLPGYRIKKVLGTVFGLVVRSRNWGAGLAAVGKSIIGGEIKIFTNMLYRARKDAADRCVGEAMGRGGNAVIALRFDMADFAGFAEVCCYGTACIVEEIRDEKQ